jgi:copper(I)-binding protein
MKRLIFLSGLLCVGCGSAAGPDQASTAETAAAPTAVEAPAVEAPAVEAPPAAAAEAAPAAAGVLAATGGWVRATPPGMPMLAGYVTLANGGDAPVTLVGASSPAVEAVELHRTEIVDGVSRMRAAGELVIAPGETLALAPGGLHMMLMRPVAPISAGDTVEVTLDLGAAGTQVLVLPVQAAAPGGAEADHGAMDHAGMDHGSMDHGSMDHGEAEADAAEAATDEHAGHH